MTRSDTAAAWVLVIVMVSGLLATGAVRPLEQLAIQLGLMLAVGLRMRSGRPWRGHTLGAWAAVATSAGLAILCGWILLPADQLAWVAPGVAAARPHDAVWTVSLRPDRVASALVMWSALASTALLVMDLAPRTRLGRVERRAAWATAAWAVLGASHGLLGVSQLFGVIDVRPGLGTFYAPLVNPNHYGIILLAGLPFVVSRLSRAVEKGSLDVLVWVGVLVWALVFPAVSASMGLLVVLGVQAALWLGLSGWGGRRGWLWALGLGVLGAAGVMERQAEWWAVSGRPRLQQYGDTWTIWSDHLLFGVGAGGYGDAYPPYRSVAAFAQFPHAHSDVLEWVVETGLVGLVSVGLAAWFAVRVLAAGPRRAWTVAVAGMVVHGLVDFPWQLPAVALVGMGLVAVWAVRTDRRWGRVRTWPVRAATGLLVAHALGAGWCGYLAWVSMEAAHVSEADAMAWVAERAPWRAEPDLVRIQRGGLSLDEVDRIASRRSDDAKVLRLLAVRLRQQGDLARAETLATRARSRDPNDFRTWALAAELASSQGDGLRAAELAAEGLRRWPREHLDGGEPLRRAYAWLPMGPWWVEALADAPAHWSVRLAWLMLEEGDHQTALDAALQAKRIRPAAHTWMGAVPEALVGLGDLEQASQYVDAWVLAAPEDPWAWLTRASLGAAWDMPRTELAEAAARAFALRPDHPKVRRHVQEAAAWCLPCDGAACEGECSQDPADRLWRAWTHKQAGALAECREELVTLFRQESGRSWASVMSWGCSREP